MILVFDCIALGAALLGIYYSVKVAKHFDAHDAASTARVAFLLSIISVLALLASFIKSGVHWTVE